MLDWAERLLALSRVPKKVGMAMASRMAMITITTMISTRLKPSSPPRSRSRLFMVPPTPARARTSLSGGGRVGVGTAPPVVKSARSVAQMSQIRRSGAASRRLACALGGILGSQGRPHPPPAVLLPGPGRGPRARAQARPRHPGQQPPVVLRLDLPSPRAPAPAHLRGQGRVLRGPQDGLVLPGRGPDPDQTGGGIGFGTGPGLGLRGPDPKRALRDLPGGDPIAGRAPAQGPYGSRTPCPA